MKPIAKKRHKPPVFRRDKDGKVESLDCPFCREPHPLVAGRESPCGTTLEIRAVQNTYRGTQVICARCKKPGGTLRKAGGNLYVHTYECTREDIYANIPKTSRVAALFWHLPDWTLKMVARFFHKTPEQLSALDENGEKTNEVVGYRWRTV